MNPNGDAAEGRLDVDLPQQGPPTEAFDHGGGIVELAVLAFEIGDEVVDRRALRPGQVVDPPPF